MTDNEATGGARSFRVRAPSPPADSAARSAPGRRWPAPLAGVLAAVTCGLLASAATVPAAFALVLPPGGQGGTASVTPVPATTVRVVTAGGMAGWQITLIALGAALLAAAAAVLLDRARAAHRAAPATS